MLWKANRTEETCYKSEKVGLGSYGAILRGRFHILFYLVNSVPTLQSISFLKIGVFKKKKTDT